MIPTKTLRERMTGAIALQLQAFGMRPRKGMVDCLVAAAIDALGDPCLIKIADSLEPTFTLRAQDKAAAIALDRWHLAAIEHGAPREKTDHALDVLDAMERWPTRKWPD